MIYLELRAGSGKATRTFSGKTIPRLGPGFYAFNGSLNALPTRLSYVANRIWQETDAGVEYVKNIGAPTQPDGSYKVDLKEFTWIKLTAKVL